ncbi:MULTISPECIES: hypothetical protein [unclassified Nostoc]|uniref:hypothetical protein n=1 Tax=unclassified Nostoc TaxID=2593658 RepID=UPI002AD80AA5|nr:hypothetical protein [Nostoc sp. DedQUE02]
MSNDIAAVRQRHRRTALTSSTPRQRKRGQGEDGAPLGIKGRVKGTYVFYPLPFSLYPLPNLQKRIFGLADY